MNLNPEVKIKVKSEREILDRLRELVSRHRKRFFKNHLKPKGDNCAFVVYDEYSETYKCLKCGTTDPENCLNHKLFQAAKTKEELAQDFSDDIHNTQKMLRDYRDIASLLWVLSQYDMPEVPLKESLSSSVETREIPDVMES